MKKYICKVRKKAASLIAFVLCIMVAFTLLPSDISFAAASDDIYDFNLITYEYNKNCHGYYFTPKKPGKYDTLVMIHGYGGVSSMKNNLVTIMNEWVKKGYFPPMVVVIPEIDDYLNCGNADGGVQFLQNFLMYIDNDDKFGTLLENLESGDLSPQIDTEGDILVGGFSMGGMSAIQAGAVHNTRIKKVGALSPANSFITEEGVPGGYYKDKNDIYFSKDPEAFAYLSAGYGESGLQFIANINRYEDAIETTGNNKPDLVTVYRAPESWGGHSWSICQKEIFMFLYFNAHGVVPTQAYVEEACNRITSYQRPTVVESDTLHPAVDADIKTYEGEALADLDMSTYVKDTATDPASASSVGGIANGGTLASSTKVKMSSQSGLWTNLDLSKQTFTNALGTTTSYLKRTINSQACKEINNFNTIEDVALENEANTISFWANYVPENNASNEYNFIDYNVTYDGESASKHLFTLNQQATSEGKFVLGGRLTESAYGDITDKAAGKWAHYVITNPAYSLNNRKVMKVYVNGEYVYSKLVVKPNGNAVNAKIAFGGEASPVDSICWPTDFSLGDVKIYDGELTSAEITSEYALNKDRYIENTSGLPNITGYTLKDSVVSYDGQNHAITVTAESGASSDTTVTYTCNGEAFAGAKEVGTYRVTAMVSKSGYNDLVLNADLVIRPTYNPPSYNSGDVLIDLDISTYNKDTQTDPDSTSSPVGGITNNGKLSASTVIKMSSHSPRWSGVDLSKKTFQNEAGEDVTYLYRTLNTTVCKDENTVSVIEEKALESGANTISFWSNYVPVKKANFTYNLFDYNVTYDGEKEPLHLFSLEQQATGRSEYVLTGRDRASRYADITDEAMGKWAHYVITNPAYENGSKTMKLYVNGKYRGSKTVERPEGTITDVKLAFGGDASKGDSIYWPNEFSLADVKVFGGDMTASEVQELYDNNKTKYIEKEISYQFDVEFVSSDKIFKVNTGNVLTGTNRVLLIVKDSSDNVVYMDSQNDVKAGYASFDVDLGSNLKKEEYTFILSIDGNTVLSGTKTCNSDKEGSGTTDEPDEPEDEPDVPQATFFDVTYDKESNSFAVSGELGKGSNKPVFNRILLMVFEPDEYQNDVPCYIDAINAHNGKFEFSVPMSKMAAVGKYTLVVSSYGNTITSGTIQCEVTDNLETFGSITPGSTIGCTYLLNANEAVPTVILAVYDDETLVHMDISNTAVDGKVSAEVKFASDENTDSYTAKTFVWKDASTLQPLKKWRVIK